MVYERLLRAYNWMIGNTFVECVAYMYNVARLAAVTVAKENSRSSYLSVINYFHVFNFVEV